MSGRGHMPDKVFSTQGNVLAYAEDLKAPARQEKKDRADRLREELDAYKYALQLLFKAMPDVMELTKAVAKWLATSENADGRLRAAAEGAMVRLGAIAPQAKRVCGREPGDAACNDPPSQSSEPPAGSPDTIRARVHPGHIAKAPVQLPAPSQQISHLMGILRLLERRAERESGNDAVPGLWCGKKAWKILSGFMRAKKSALLSGSPDALIRVPEIPGLFDDISEIDWSALFCFTGIFAFGERHDCEA